MESNPNPDRPLTPHAERPLPSAAGRLMPAPGPGDSLPPPAGTTPCVDRKGLRPAPRPQENGAASLPPAVLEDNLKHWSGDHLIAADQVPGLLAANRPVVVDNPSVIDIAPTILSVFGIEKPSVMTGRPLFTAAGRT